MDAVVDVGEIGTHWGGIEGMELGGEVLLEVGEFNVYIIRL